jgi:hypothetical protein
MDAVTFSDLSLTVIDQCGATSTFGVIPHTTYDANGIEVGSFSCM